MKAQSQVRFSTKSFNFSSISLSERGSNSPRCASSSRGVPGSNGSLFRKNVRQSLGSNKVNRGIARTIKNEPGEFFFLHNGITAICSEMSYMDGVLNVKELNVVNGCQSLSTILNCSESAKKADDAYIMFRFYEISNTDRADSISTSTNSQTAVKARDP